MLSAARPIHQASLNCSGIINAPNRSFTAVSRVGCNELKAQAVELLSSILRTVAVSALETLHAATGINQLLSTSVERVTLVAQLDVQVSLGRSGHEGVPARAMNRRRHILWMYIAFHTSVLSLP
jgi:hypothetical protein